jgi:uncharacterized membrane protein YkoI
MPLNLIQDMLRITATLLFLASICNSSSRATPACITDWSVAAPIVYREKLATVEALSRIAADKLSGSSIVRTILCEENGRYSYRVVMRDAGGRLSTHTVDAREPFNR